MSDDDVRALERAARASPTDVVAGWAYAHALERSGDSRGRLLELCRLSRLGDRAAERAVSEWHPWPARHSVSGTRRSPRSGVRQGMVTRLRRIVLPDAPARRWRFAAASDDALVFAALGALAAVDARELALTWERLDVEVRDQGTVALTGDRLVSGHMFTLELHDLATGAALERVDLLDTGQHLGVADLESNPSPENLINLQSLAVWGDRAVLRIGSPHDAGAFVAIDVGRELGRTLWRRSLAESNGAEALVGGSRALLLHGSDLELERLDLETGITLDRRHVPSRSRLTGADEHGAIICHRDHRRTQAREYREGQEPLWRLYEMTFGQLLRLSVRDRVDEQPALTDQLAVMVEGSRRSGLPQELVAMPRVATPADRQTRYPSNAVRWRVPLARTHVWRELAVTDEAVFLTSLSAQGVARCAAYDLQDGSPLFDLELASGLSVGDVVHVDVVPLDRAVIVVVVLQSELLMARIE